MNQKSHLIHCLIVVTALVVLAAGVAVQAQTESIGVPPETVFESPSEYRTVVNAGTIRLVWGVDTTTISLDSLVFELQEASDSAFTEATIRYRGPDLATFISGLEDDDYFFRVRSISLNDGQAGPWSEVILVVVEHHSLQLALTLFAVGSVVFLATVGVVIHGSRKAEGETAEA